MKKNTIIFLIAVILSMVLLMTGACAESNTPYVSDNKGTQDYSSRAYPVNSYLYENGDNMTRVEWVDPKVIVEDYSLEGKLLSQKLIDAELQYFGGYYTYGGNHYIVYGQSNDAESDANEIIRIVKYDDEWKRVASVSICGENTTYPFTAGSLRMIGSGNNLIIRTCHQMYRSAKDGLRHQANMTIAVNTDAMTVTDIRSQVSSPGTGYVSHSFNQFVAQNGTDLIAADHGDAYPRAIVLYQYDGTMDTGKIQKVTRTDVLTMNGNIGQNTTGTSLGGLEISSSSILVAGNSVDHAGNAPLNANRNVFVGVVDKADKNSTSVRWITNYPSDGEQGVSTPQLVKVNENSFLLLWTENGNSTKIRKLDGQGNVLDAKDYDEQILSDCQPRMIGNRIRWYTTKDSAPTFYSIDPSDLSSLKKTGSNVLEGVQISEKTMTLDIGETGKLSASLIPSDTSEDVQIEWNSWEPAVATVSESGVVTAKTNGETIIEVVARSKTHEYRDHCSLTVTNEHLKVCPSQHFVDVERSTNHWTHVPIDYVLTKGYMAGISENRFAPNGTVTRGTIAQILYAAEGKPVVYTSNRFQDVRCGEWYANAVNWAAEKGLVTGYGGGRFGPEDSVTRQQMVAIMYQYAKMKGFDITESGDLSKFSDRNMISSWAVTPMKWAVGHQVVGGTGKGIEPNGTATRAQIAVILQAFDNNVRR